MQKIIILLLFFITTTLLANDSSIKKVVYDATTAQKALFEKNILKGIEFHKTYYEGRLEELEVAVVIHGDAYKFFVKDLSKTEYKKIPNGTYSEIQKRLKSLADLYDVEFFICEVGMKKHHISKENILSFAKVSATSTVALIDKQNEGFAYIPVR